MYVYALPEEAMQRLFQERIYENAKMPEVGLSLYARAGGGGMSKKIFCDFCGADIWGVNTKIEISCHVLDTCGDCLEKIMKLIEINTTYCFRTRGGLK